MPTFTYAQTKEAGGGTSTLEAPTANDALTALSKTAGADPHSGVSPATTLSSDQGKKVITGTVAPAISDATAMQDAATKSRQATDTSNSDLSTILTPEEQASAQLNNDPEVQAYKDSINSLTLANNADAQAQIASLNQSYQELRQETVKSNQYREASYVTSDIRSGMSRYSPTGAADLESTVRNQGLKKLSDIDEQYNAEVAAVKAAVSAKNYTVAANGAQNILALKKDFLATIQKNTEEAKKLLNTQKMNDAMVDIIGSGETDPAKIFQALKEKGIAVTSVKDITDTIASLTKAKSPLDDILSVDESVKLGVPFGTTKREAYGLQAKSKGTIGDLTPAQQNAAFKMADDYEAKSKDFFTIKSQFERLKASAKNPSAAGDLSMIFAYMKILDPTSVVREGEFATAQNSGSAFQRLGAQYNKVLSGQRLTQTQRNDFLDRGGSLYEAQKGFQQQNQDLFTRRAEQLGIPAEFVVTPLNDVPDASEPPATRLQKLYQASPENAQKIKTIMKTENITDPQDILDIFGEAKPLTMTASTLAQSIAMAETGNKPTKGASGENGAFQFLPTTWAKISMETTGRLLPQTQENERQVATAKIQKLLEAGHTPEEIALIWNTSLGGTEQPRRIAGVNSKGIAYDSNAYARKVMKYYKQFS